MTSTAQKLLIGGAVLAGLGAIAVMFVIPAETGWDPTGIGAATGLVAIADPRGPGTILGEARMARQTVLELSDTRPAPIAGATDHWEYTLAPFESVEFKYTIAAGQRIAFHWQASGPLHYDMHGHPFDGGPEKSESYSIGEVPMLQGRYTAAFTGIHGWYWTNRSMDTVTFKLDASGGMSHSTIYVGNGADERPIPGAGPIPEGTAEGHQMQQPVAATEAGG